ncbi:helix-turn-helix domain-containing protein [Methanosalsum natronophilum]|uniref:helix-turn-helix domain-containing protein n=1 Tax=Methanosalsum natronophilum TaxID=768733 RepID=UPI002167D3E8|nr:XRE family transcriptional regulator [Methanosalsum natronophilum]MCS3924307.1 transcriptional regulator with XRE-family HTH domain [Methanosalsum natronophilum]
MEKYNYVGAKVRQLREEREMKLEDLAHSSQCCVELIEQIENGSLIPSLSPLLQISRGLGVRLGTLLDGAEQDGPIITTYDSSHNVMRFSGNTSNNNRPALEFYSLAADKKDRHMEPFLIDIKSLNDKNINLSSHEGEEFIFVLEGEIEIVYGKDKFNLKKGDSIYYDSVVPHNLYSTKEDGAKIIAIIYTPF